MEQNCCHYSSIQKLASLFKKIFSAKFIPLRIPLPFVASFFRLRLMNLSLIGFIAFVIEGFFLLSDVLLIGVDGILVKVHAVFSILFFLIFFLLISGIISLPGSLKADIISSFPLVLKLIIPIGENLTIPSNKIPKFFNS